MRKPIDVASRAEAVRLAHANRWDDVIVRIGSKVWSVRQDTDGIVSWCRLTFMEEKPYDVGAEWRGQYYKSVEMDK